MRNHLKNKTRPGGSTFLDFDGLKKSTSIHSFIHSCLEDDLWNPICNYIPSPCQSSYLKYLSCVLPLQNKCASSWNVPTWCVASHKVKYGSLIFVSPVLPRPQPSWTKRCLPNKFPSLLHTVGRIENLHCNTVRIKTGLFFWVLPTYAPFLTQQYMNMGEGRKLSMGRKVELSCSSYVRK